MVAEPTAVVPVRGANDEVVAYRLGSRVSTLGDRRNLCAGERFEQQPVAGFCSATLIAPDLIATAAHCITRFQVPPEQAWCDDYKIVFGFDYKASSDHPTDRFDTIPRDQVYSCSRVEGLRLSSYPARTDWAIIRLDRPVSNRQPVALLADKASTGASVLQIGHPTGIPQKLVSAVVTDDAQNSSSLSAHGFSYNGDIFSGNSGGGIFDLAREALAGIAMVYSGRDYVREQGQSCLVAGICDDNVTCSTPPTAFSAQVLLEHIAEDNPALLDELTIIGEFDYEPPGDNNQAEALTYTSEYRYEIPDDSATPLHSTIEVTDEGEIDAMRVRLQLSHRYLGDLSADLISPEGYVHPLFQQGERHGYQLDEIFPVSRFSGFQAQGLWYLRLRDHLAYYKGSLDGWSLSVTHR